MVIRFFIIKIELNIILFFKNTVNHGNSFLQNQNQTKCNSFQKETKEKSFSVLCYRFSYICLQISCFIYKFADAKIVH